MDGSRRMEKRVRRVKKGGERGREKRRGEEKGEKRRVQLVFTPRSFSARSHDNENDTGDMGGPN